MPFSPVARGLKSLLSTIFAICLFFNSSAQDCIDALERSTFNPNDLEYLENLLRCFDYLRENNQRDSIYRLEGILLASRNASEVAQNAEVAMELNYRLGLYYSSTSDPSKAISAYISSLKYSEELRDSSRMSTILSSLGILNYSYQRWQEALNYFNRAKAMIHSESIDAQRSTTLYLIGLCYKQLGLNESARENLNKAKSIAIARADSNRMFECTLGLAALEVNEGKFEEALKDYAAAMIYYENKREPIALAYIFNGMAEAQAHLGKWGLVKSYADKAYNFSSRSSDTEPIIEALRLRSLAYEKTGETEKALASLRSYQAFKDSLLKRDVSAQIALASSKYDFEKREIRLNQQIKEDKQKRQALAIFTALLGLLVLSALYAYYSVRKERKKSEDLLLNILPKRTVEELKKYGTAISKKHEGVSILFCDAKGFTSISEKLSPEELVDMIDHYFRAFDEVVEKHGIEKIKTIGDAYMCVSGLADEVLTNNAHSMARASIEMLAASKKVSKQMNQRYGFGFTFRFGIHHGNLVSGVVGFRKYAYDVWGDAVNLAARMEQSGEPGWINISGAMYKSIKDNFRCTYRGKITAKNKGEIDMFFLEEELQSSAIKTEIA